MCLRFHLQAFPLSGSGLERLRESFTFYIFRLFGLVCYYVYMYIHTYVQCNTPFDMQICTHICVCVWRKSAQSSKHICCQICESEKPSSVGVCGWDLRSVTPKKLNCFLIIFSAHSLFMGERTAYLIVFILSLECSSGGACANLLHLNYLYLELYTYLILLLLNFYDVKTCTGRSCIQFTRLFF
jgi:hypothetical protein